MSLQSDIRNLKALRSKASALVEKIASRRTQSLNGIHESHGFETVEEFISAVQAANSTERGGKRRKPPGPATSSDFPTSRSPGKRRRRSKITPEMKDQLKAMVKAGRTGKEIAKQLGISLPSVHNVKKDLGLTKTRK